MRGRGGAGGGGDRGSFEAGDVALKPHFVSEGLARRSAQ